MATGDAARWRDFCQAIMDKDWTKVSRMVYMYEIQDKFTEQEFERIFASWTDIRQQIEQARLVEANATIPITVDQLYCPNCNAALFKHDGRLYERVPCKALTQNKTTGRWQVVDGYAEHYCP